MTQSAPNIQEVVSYIYLKQLQQSILFISLPMFAYNYMYKTYDRSIMLHRYWTQASHSKHSHFRHNKQILNFKDNISIVL